MCVEGVAEPVEREPVFRDEVGTDARASSCSNRCMERRTLQHPEGKPTVKQVYALARELCERAGEKFPSTRADASELIERLRIENGRG